MICLAALFILFKLVNFTLCILEVLLTYQKNSSYPCISKLLGACIVAVGIIVVISPTFQAGGEFTLWWSLALVVSCIPMVLR